MTDEERRTYIGGPAVAAIVGVSPYQSPIQVWRFARGLDDGPEQTERMRLGLILEQAIADAYTEQSGRKVRKVGLVRHKTYPFLGGHPDRLVVGEPGILEAKAAVTTAGYGEENVPPHVRVQCQWYMGLTGRQWADVALLAHLGLTIVRVEHDPELWNALVEAAIRFWTDHVLAGVEPPPDGTEAYRRHLAERFPRSSEVQLIATPEQALLVEELRSATSAEVAAKKHLDEIENRIRKVMDDAAELISPDGRITYRNEKPRVRWQEVAQAIANDAEVDVTEYAARDTEGRDGPRVLRKHFAKSEEEGTVAA